jgi:hypothetical protein
VGDGSRDIFVNKHSGFGYSLYQRNHAT